MILTRSYEMRVWYVDTDQMGIVHHSNYVKYYEAARSDLMRDLGVSYAEMERRGVMMPILEVHSIYKASARFDEVIRVEISLEQLPMARINFLYTIYGESGTLLNTGSTVLGFMHSDTRRPTRAPKWFVEMLESAAADSES
ncbi:MAG: thioesterase family protein [Rikenellaceae bacterium]